jgi:hypothetical protein
MTVRNQSTASELSPNLPEVVGHGKWIRLKMAIIFQGCDLAVLVNTGSHSDLIPTFSGIGF